MTAQRAVTIMLDALYDLDVTTAMRLFAHAFLATFVLVYFL